MYEILWNPQPTRVFDAQIHAVDVLLPRFPFLYVVVTDVNKYVALDVRAAGLLVYLQCIRAASVDDLLGHVLRSVTGREHDDGLVCFRVGSCGHTLVSVQLRLVPVSECVDQTVYREAAAGNHIGETPLVDLPFILQQHSSSHVLAVGTPFCHLLQMKVTAIGKVQLGDCLRHFADRRKFGFARHRIE